MRVSRARNPCYEILESRNDQLEQVSRGVNCPVRKDCTSDRVGMLCNFASEGFSMILSSHRFMQSANGACGPGDSPLCLRLRPRRFGVPISHHIRTLGLQGPKRLHEVLGVLPKDWELDERSCHDFPALVFLVASRAPTDNDQERLPSKKGRHRTSHIRIADVSEFPSLLE